MSADDKTISVEEMRIVEGEIDRSWNAVAKMMSAMTLERETYRTPVANAMAVIQAAVLRVYLETIPTEYGYLQTLHDDTIASLRKKIADSRA